jgi:hypothetical protein
MGLVKTTEDDPITLTKDTADTAPKKPRGRPKGSTSKPAEQAAPPTRAQTQETKMIEETLTKVLSMPGIIFALNGDEYCAQHYENQAPELAKQIAIASLRYPQLRKYFLGVPTASQNLALVAAIVAYLYAPIAHHVSGVPRLPALSLMGIPVPPEDVFEQDEVILPDKLTEKQVLEALLIEAEQGEKLTVEAEELIRAEGFGRLLDERDEQPVAGEPGAPEPPTFGPDGP